MNTTMNPIHYPNSPNPTMSNNMTAWSWAEDKIFEDALVKFPEEVANRWGRIADCLPGKSMDDVVAHYEALLHDVGQIDSGLVELPRYSDELVGLMKGAGGSSRGSVGGKDKQIKRERKKGNPWTVEEHRLFLRGLELYGRSDWRSISRYLVKTRLPSQVASHAQKYFNRHGSETKVRKRSSIHDITTPANCSTAPQMPHNTNISSPADCLAIPQRSNIHEIKNSHVQGCFADFNSIVPQMSNNINISSPADCLAVPQRSNIHKIKNSHVQGSFADFNLIAPQMSNNMNILSPPDCLAVPQRSNIHKIKNSHVQECFPDFNSIAPQMSNNINISSPADCLAVPEISNIHKINNSQVQECFPDFNSIAPQMSNNINISSPAACLTVPQRSNIHQIKNSRVQECFPDFNFSM